MELIKAKPAKLTELSWLVEVTESRQPLSELCPIWVRHGIVHSGLPVPHSERHPYCEFGTTVEGIVESLVEREQARRLPGDLFLAGPGVAHWARITKSPFKFITVYFLPSVLIELGPESDGPKILRRFTMPQSLAQRLVRPPAELRDRLLHQFKEIVIEFERSRFGREVRLRTLLMEQLVQLLRWESDAGLSAVDAELEFDWKPVHKALQYIREHFTEPIYARNVARATGKSETRLNVLFHKALGISWVKYLQSYRIHRAAALLSESGCNVTEAALATGFESLSHFNVTFRSFMGVAPTVYQKRKGAK
jgi:AraC-like DNA-binding protein